jgi:hypothetical protein
VSVPPSRLRASARKLFAAAHPAEATVGSPKHRAKANGIPQQCTEAARRRP